MYEDLMPCGSVVKLKGDERFVMICGRIVIAEGNDHIYDYTGCHYPEGVSGKDHMLFFDRDTIERTLFIGFQDKQELEYHSFILNKLGELKVVDGEIVEA